MLELAQPRIVPAAGMDLSAAELIQRIAEEELTIVAASAAGLPGARLAGSIGASDVVSAHGDRRTVGVVRVTGHAEAGERRLAWSAVAKIIDLNIPPGVTNTWVRPTNEVAFYERHPLASDGSAFRPARCHLVSRPSPGVVVLWLEDMTSAAAAPFSLDQLRQILRHVGQWNAWHLARRPELPFIPGRDSIELRWRQWDYDGDLAMFVALADSFGVKAMYGSRPLDLPFALRDALLAVSARALDHVHTLCYGDCNVGNLFWLPNETVAVDWASLTIDPLGVDAGSVVGSASSWGRNAMDVIRNERALFEEYLAGLIEAGWRGQRDDVRRGYLHHLGIYLLSSAIFPAFVRRFDRAMVERRAGVPYEEVPALNAPLVDFIPSYLEELAALA